MNPRVLLPVLLLALALSGCTGSGAINPLSPRKAQDTGSPDSTSAASDTVYWAPFPANPPVTATLQGVALVSENLGWIVGNGGTILQYDGKTWKRVQTGVTNLPDLYACSFPNDHEGWAVGAKGFILSYQDGRWSQVESPTTENLFDVYVTGTRKGWAVGSNGTLIAYTGSTWEPVTLKMPPDSSGAEAKVTVDLFGLGFSSGSIGSAVGDRGTIVRFDGSKWDVDPSPPSSERLLKTAWVSDVEGWAVGAYGTIQRFNGTSWTKVAGASTQDLYDVTLTSSQDGWAVGQDGSMAHYDGSRWVLQHPAPGKPALNAVAFLRKNFGFAVGQNGTILKYQPGGEKSEGDLKMDPRLGPKTEGDPPIWNLQVTLLNDGAKPVSNASFEVELPKGYYPVRPSPTVTPTPFKPLKPGDKPPPPPTPTPTATPVPGETVVPSPVAVTVRDFKWSGGKAVFTLGQVDPNVQKVVTLDITRPPSQTGKKSPAAVVSLTARINGKALSAPVPFQLEALPKDGATPVATAAAAPKPPPAPHAPPTQAPFHRPPAGIPTPFVTPKPAAR